MTIKKKQLALLIGQAISLMALAGAQQAAYADEKLQRVEVTGSAIKRADVEGPAPVEVVTRKDIERTGATTVNELLKSVATMDIYDQGELASNSPTGSGSANIRLRGMGETNVLVLLNGKRLPVAAMSDASGAGAAVDLSTLPLAAIDRIEILKDGGSAIYGADAVAGVVNFITRKDFTGLQAFGYYGMAEAHGGKEKHYGVTGGFGNLDQDRYNVMFSIDKFDRDPIYRKDREISQSVDYRRYGSRDGRSSFAPQGNVLDPVTGNFVPGVSVRPCPPENFNGRCRYDFNSSLLTAMNGADRLNSLVTGTVRLTENITGYASLIYSRTKDHFLAHPVPDYFPISVASNPALAPYDDGSGVAWIAGRFMQGGPRTTDRKTSLNHFTVGLDGQTKLFDWAVSAGQGVSRMRNSDSNYYNANLWNAAVSAGLLDPTVNTNSQTLVDSLKVTPTRTARSELSWFDAKISGELFKLPAGPLGYAVGASVMREKLVDTPDELTQQGLVTGSIAQSAVSASRNTHGVFAELNIPVIKEVEVQAAIRHDVYKQYNATTPKLAVKYQPIKPLTLRLSYAEAFRAPTLKQMYGAQEQGAINLEAEVVSAMGLDPAIYTGIPAWQVGGGNPGLKPEKGKTWDFGVAFDLPYGISGAFDYWIIDKKDAIGTPSLETAAGLGNFSFANGRYSIYTTNTNFAKTNNEGIDVDLTWKSPKTEVGTFTVRDAATYYIHVRNRGEGETQWAEYVKTYATPQWRNIFITSWQYGVWNSSLTNRTVSGFYDSPTANTRTGKKVQYHNEMDLAVDYTGIKNLTLTGGIKNLLDKTPPFSETNATNNAYTQQGFAELYSSRGRFFYMRGNYTFK